MSQKFSDNLCYKRKPLQVKIQSYEHVYVGVDAANW